MKPDWNLTSMTAAIVCLTVAGAAHADAVPYSLDINAKLASLTVADESVVIDDLTMSPTTLDLGSLPSNVDVDAFELLPTTSARLFSIDVAAELPGGVTAMPGDVIRYDAGSYTIVFDASAEGVPAGSNVDAMAVGPLGGALLSFDVTTDLGSGVVADDEDVVRWYGSSYTLILDGSAEGLPTELDIDGLGADLSTGAIFVSLDGSGQVDGVDFDDDTVLMLDQGVWSVVFDLSADYPGSESVDVNAVPEPVETVSLLAGLVLLTSFGIRKRVPRCK